MALPASAPSYDSALIIEELSGDGTTRRELRLLGPALPHMGAEWAFENGLATSWNPGNPEATQQVLGPRELPSSWQGTWRLPQMTRLPSRHRDVDGSESDLTSPQLLRDLFEDFGRKGRRLRVSWVVSGEGIPGVPGVLTRVGRIANAHFPHDRTTDIAWSAEFAWLGRGNPRQLVVASRGDNIPSAMAALEASMTATYNLIVLNKIVASNARVPRSATQFTLGQLEVIAGAPQKISETLARSLSKVTLQAQQAGQIAKKVRSQPSAVENSALSVARGALQAANQFDEEMGRAPAETLSARATASDVMRAADHFAHVVDAALLVLVRAHAVSRQIRTTNPGSQKDQLPPGQRARAGDLLARHVVRDGETPQSIAVRYYGNADCDLEILRANRLPDHQVALRRGSILVIPVLKAARRA